jgi:pyruvate/2-oxoglutarate dehydrogenase complex dihydrolipoamide dehydrogenase (E3) component
MHLIKDKVNLFGIEGVNPAEIRFNLAAAVARKDIIVQGIINGIHKGLERNKNISFITGQAEFTSPKDIKIDGKTITSEKTILAVGSRPYLPDISGLEEAGYITNNEALQLRELPDSMIIIGGGYIGVEFAQMYSRFGTQVTIFGRAPRLMKNEEPELSEILAELLSQEGITVHTSAEVLRAGKDSNNRFVIARVDGKEKKFIASEILLAAGRIARIEDLGLDQAGIEMENSFIIADDQLRTTAPNTWTLGDANGGLLFTHRATYDGPIAALNSVKGAVKKVNYRVLPRAIFSEPALASVGLTEAEAKEAGLDVKTGISYFKNSGRAKAIAQTEGLAKIVVDNKTNKILGGHILGPRADDLIHEVVVAMQGLGTLETLTKSIHIHPTLSEVVKNAAKAAR